MQSNRLELHFRPEDPYSHPAFGDLRPCNNLLLKISKTKSSDGQSSGISNSLGMQEGGNNLDDRTQIGALTKEAQVPTPEDDQTTVSADVVARVLGAYHFDG